MADDPQPQAPDPKRGGGAVGYSPGASLIGDDLRGRSLAGHDLMRSWLVRATMDEHSDFTRSLLFQAVLDEVSGTDPDFSGADMRHVQARDVRLRHPKLRGALVEDGDFRGTDITGWDFDDAWINGTRFDDSNAPELARAHREPSGVPLPHGIADPSEPLALRWQDLQPPLHVSDGEVVDARLAPHPRPDALPDPAAYLTALGRVPTFSDLGAAGPVSAATTVFNKPFLRDALVIAGALEPYLHTATGTVDASGRRIYIDPLTDATVRYFAALQAPPMPDPRSDADGYRRALGENRLDNVGAFAHEAWDVTPTPDGAAIAPVAAPGVRLKNELGWEPRHYGDDDGSVTLLNTILRMALVDERALDETVHTPDGVTRSYADVLRDGLHWFNGRLNDAGLFTTPHYGQRFADGKWQGVNGYTVLEDAFDAIVYQDGRFPKNWIAATQMLPLSHELVTRAAELAERHPARAADLGIDPVASRARAGQMVDAFDNWFWVRDSTGNIRYPAVGVELDDRRQLLLNHDGRPTTTDRLSAVIDAPRDSMAFVLGTQLFAGVRERWRHRGVVGDPAEPVLRTLFDPGNGMLVPAGLRSLSSHARGFDPGSYDRGSISTVKNLMAANAVSAEGYGRLGWELTSRILAGFGVQRLIPEFYRGEGDKLPQINLREVTALTRDSTGTERKVTANPISAEVIGWTAALSIPGLVRLHDIAGGAPELRRPPSASPNARLERRLLDDIKRSGQSLASEQPVELARQVLGSPGHGVALLPRATPTASAGHTL